LTSNPNFTVRTPESVKHATAKHEETKPKPKKGFLSRLKELDPKTAAANTPLYYEALTDVARDVQYFAEGVISSPLTMRGGKGCISDLLSALFFFCAYTLSLIFFILRYA
jgi:hypothetical protein